MTLAAVLCTKTTREPFEVYCARDRFWLWKRVSRRGRGHLIGRYVRFRLMRSIAVGYEGCFA